MKSRLFYIFMLILSFQSKAQNLITSDIYKSVFLIKYGTNTGTCFLVSINNNDYLITAKHLFTNTISIKDTVEIEILKENSWIKLKTTYLINSNPDIDIAVLDLKSNDKKENLFDIGSKNFYLSQECFFLGFPFGLKMDDNKVRINNGFPIPFVKKGIISSFISDSSGITRIFLDGHNNPGFSGGPVVISNFGDGNQHKMRVIGVVSAYLNEDKIIKTPFGNFKNSENSGIVLSYAFQHIIDIIDGK